MMQQNKWEVIILNEKRTMKKTIILLAGYPGTGKSYLCNMILDKEDRFKVLSQDETKEKLWDEIGFDDLYEKEMVTQLSWNYYYKNMKELMQSGTAIISDYPFSDKQKPMINFLSKKYGYQVITIRLIADLDVLFKRQEKRDLDTKRHLAHIVSCYHSGDTLEDRSKADCLVDYDEFIKRCKTRGYGIFELGHLIELDVTDFNQVDYKAVIKQLEDMLY